MSIAETLSTFTICPKRSDGSGGLERGEIIALYALDFNFFFFKNIMMVGNEQWLWAKAKPVDNTCV